jgi:hypothetical protein
MKNVKESMEAEKNKAHAQINRPHMVGVFSPEKNY